MKRSIFTLIGVVILLVAGHVEANAPGVQLVEIQSGSVYEKIGLKAGDILTSFNKKPLTNEQEFKQFYEELIGQARHHITLHLLRDGKPLDLEYDIQPESKEDKLLNEPCGRVVLVKCSKDGIEVILRPTGAKANRGEVFNRKDFDLNLVSQAALKALDSKNLLFCAHMNDANVLEFYITK